LRSIGRELFAKAFVTKAFRCGPASPAEDTPVNLPYRSFLTILVAVSGNATKRARNIASVAGTGSDLFAWMRSIETKAP
jgi:hypothetical protein